MKTRSEFRGQKKRREGWAVERKSAYQSRESRVYGSKSKGFYVETQLLQKRRGLSVDDDWGGEGSGRRTKEVSSRPSFVPFCSHHHHAGNSPIAHRPYQTHQMKTRGQISASVSTHEPRVCESSGGKDGKEESSSRLPLLPSSSFLPSTVRLFECPPRSSPRSSNTPPSPTWICELSLQPVVD